MAEFGEAPSLWMQKRLIEDIKYRLADKRIPLKELVEEFNLSSVSHLVRLCKKYLGETPGEFRRNLGNDMK
ncbi:helix-turn-helix domain-containing protein [Bacteroides neonati]|uniref:helix-turn-helix domain-containing protein n=1 Tax=Bacteroides neonati TaxID=1347393 RepID=UPI0004B1B789|nr:AraC family transcriptional regulator [Bacteroides neonati]